MFVSHDQHGNTTLPAVMVPKDGAIIASAVGTEHIGFTGGRVVPHAGTGVPVARTLQYRVEGPGARDVSVEHHAGAEVSTASGTTLWELLYFGNGRDRPYADHQA
jgi:hypothetical protein